MYQKKFNNIIIVGGMANTFLAAQGTNIGSSFYEKDMIDEANKIMEKAKSIDCDIILPVDAVVADKLEFGVESFSIDLNNEIVLFCAAGGRSALAAKTLQEMGFKKVSHIKGGFSAMKSKGFKIT